MKCGNQGSPKGPRDRAEVIVTKLCERIPRNEPSAKINTILFDQRCIRRFDTEKSDEERFVYVNSESWSSKNLTPNSTPRRASDENSKDPKSKTDRKSVV